MRFVENTSIGRFCIHFNPNKYEKTYIGTHIGSTDNPKEEFPKQRRNKSKETQIL